MTPEQLKASILQRAMEGKLVPQNPNDEPASELLKRIKAEKEKLISEGKIKRDKKETEIFRGDDGKHYGKFADGSTQEIDVPYDIPDTWEWVRFSTLVEIVRGGSPRPIKDYLTSEVDGINWIKIGDTEKGEKYINNVKEKIKKSGLNKTRFVKKGTFLLTNSMSFGRPYILNVDGAIHDGWLAISNYENSLNKDYLFYILSSNVVYSQFLSLISGAVVKNLNSDKVASILIPLPPLSEQQRIIEAIESALEKVDEYAESYNRLEQLDKEFPDKLKKSILQYAMQGKLVEQDPNDESVEVLLEKIRAEKQKLFEEGKIKKKDLDISIVSQGDDNSYYGNIPMNWVVIKIKDIFSMNTGLSYKKGDLSINNKGVRIIRGGNIKPLEFSLLDNDYYIDTQFISSEQVYLKHNQLGSPRPIKDYLTSEVDGINWIKIGDTEKGEKYINNVKEKIKKSGLNKTRFVKKGTFLLTNSMSFGRPYILNVDGAIHDGWLAISNYENSLNKDYLFYILSSNVVYSQFLSLISGAVVKNLNSDKVASILIPLPPLSEQQRIIEAIESALEKVDEYAESYNRLEQLDKEFPDKLKKSILQYAMQGKLVEQDPNDESVEVLLEKIRAEKQKLFEEGKIKKKDLDISIVSQGDDNSYYGNIPMNWVVIKIKDIFSMNTGLSYKKGDLSINNKGVRIIRGGNIKPLEFSLLDNDYYIDTQFISSEQVYLKHNQLITPVSTSLEHIGKFARIDKDYDGVVAGGFIFQLTPFESSEIISKFLLFNLSSPLFYKQLKAITKLSGQALYNIPKTTLSELLIPLAPFEEQELITQKVEKLFEKVNQLWK
ncbi:type I restriction-modification system S protein [Streptococcus pneumoniae]|nr:type I restriction-modification system S protein [Streptococcus pneumoniae]